ncbi:MAG: hypothetical protein ACOC7U_10950 [Spirochaetota bacterium]
MDFSEDYRFNENPVYDDYDGESYINRTYVCEDCDFRWTDKIYPEKNDYPDYEDELSGTRRCPMCGSINVSFY